MKPHNLLVFKDQLIKIGDLGTLIRFEKDVDPDSKIYTVKGLSRDYSSE